MSANDMITTPHRPENTLETSGKDVKLHSKRVEKMTFKGNQLTSCAVGDLQVNLFRNVLKGGAQLTRKTTLVLSVVHIFSTRFECSFHIFSSRFECVFTSSPLVSSVVFTSPPLVSSVAFTSSRLVSR